MELGGIRRDNAVFEEISEHQSEEKEEEYDANPNHQEEEQKEQGNGDSDIKPGEPDGEEEKDDKEDSERPATSQYCKEDTMESGVEVVNGGTPIAAAAGHVQDAQ